MGGAYVLTFDQDTIVSSDLIEIYTEYTGCRDIASITCLREDRNYPVKECKTESDYMTVN